MSLGSTSIDFGNARVDFAALLNQDYLQNVGEYSRRFKSAQPFSHVVFDGLFSAELLKAVWDEFEQASFLNITDGEQNTFRTHPGAQIGPAGQIYFSLIHSGAFLKFLTDVSGIAGLVPDPLLRGGGYHESRSGGRFDLHLDFSKHSITQLNNRLSFITYLNEDWHDEFGGALELWSISENRCVEKVMPMLGRSVLFQHSPISLHGHPDPMKLPPGRTRRSVAAYYYTNGTDDVETNERYSTYFRMKRKLTPAQTIKTYGKYLLPPAIVDVGRILLRKPPTGARQ